MSRKALKVVVELRFRAVSCPGVHLAAKDDIYLSMCVMGQYRKSECLPAIFPLLFHEKMTFEKIFRHAVDPGDIAVMLEYETVKIELVQLIPPVGETLACFEEDARHFLFPEPKLVPSFSGVDREVLMTRAPHFPGIAPRLEFSTKTTISECSADAETIIYPNVLMRPVIKKQMRRSRKQRSASPQGLHSHTLERGRGRVARDWHTAKRASQTPRSHSHSPFRASCRGLAQLSLGSRTSSQPNRDTSTISEPCSHHANVALMAWGQALSLTPPLGAHRQIRPPQQLLFRFTQVPIHRSRSSSQGMWEEVQERVRRLLTTPKAVRRLVYGATVSEVDEVLARRSISPAPM
ncbi:spermatogenesis associated 6-like protein [Polymixia lowei]